MPNRGSQGSRCGACSTTIARSAVSTCPSTMTFWSPNSSSRRRRTGAKGIVAEYRSQAVEKTRNPSARATVSANRRVFPIPGGPTTSTIPPEPRLALSNAASIAASSCDRPTSGMASAPASSLPLEPRIRPSTDAETGFALPFTMNGSSARSSNRVADRARTGSVERSSPGCAFAMTRAARFTASPITVYVRRYGGPTSPTNTCPRFTPIRTGSSRLPSDDAVQGEEHPLVVVAGGPRGSRDEDDLAPVVDRRRWPGT